MRITKKENLLLGIIPDKLKDKFVIDLVYAHDNAFGDSEIVEIVDDFISAVTAYVSNLTKKTRGMKL
jgi:hypothetical protein